MKTFSRDFKLMVIGQVISLFGASILRFALSLYILEISGSATIFGTILGVSVIPTIFISPVGGVIADRFNRKKLMVIFDFASSFIVAMFAIFLSMGNNSIIAIGLLMTGLTIISAMYQPTVQSSIPLLVPENMLLKSNGVVSGVVSVANFLGPIIGGILYSVLDIRVIVIVSSLSFFLSAIMEIFINIPFEKKQQSHHMVKTIINDMKEGIHYILKENTFILKSIGIACLINLFVVPIFLVGLPYMIKVMLKMPDTYYGFTQAGMSLSIIFSAMTIGILKDKIKDNNLYLWICGCGLFFGFMAFGVSNLVTNALTKYLIISVSSIFVMFSLTVVSIFITTLIQKETPNSLLGKVVSIQTAVAMTAIPIGQIMFGILVDFFANKIYLLILGVGILSWIIGVIAKHVFKTNKIGFKMFNYKEV